MTKSKKSLWQIIGDDYELNKEFYEEMIGCIFCFVSAHYEEKLTYDEFLLKYYKQKSISKIYRIEHHKKVFNEIEK